MKIQKIEIRHLDIPFRTPFTTSFGTITSRHVVVGKVFSTLGETIVESPTLEAPIYSEETTWTVMDTMQRHIGPRVIGKEIATAADVARLLSPIKRNYMAKHFVDTAVYHLLSEYTGQSLSQQLGGSKKTVPVGLSIGIEASVQALLDKVQYAVDQGFKRIKIKIRPGWDVDIVRQVRDHFGAIPLTVDANSAYCLEDLDTFIALDQFDLIMVEQPLREDDLIDHAKLQSFIQTPICLDESIETLDDARQAIDIGACRIINIKPGRVGGLYPSTRIHDLCRQHHISLWVGGMGETAIGKLDAIALASLPGVDMPSDIGPSIWYFEEDLIEPSFEVHNGEIRVPESPGIGFDVDPARIEKHTVEKFVI